jgi:cytidine deaminase
MEKITDELLVKKALDARENSYSPYSKYRVGAALLCDDGTVYTGCNVENASYPCGICAERNAMAAAVAGGHRKFSKIAISGSSEAVCTPCGMCRQFMYEFSPNLTVLCAGSGGDFVSKSLKDLLVDGFGPENM